MSNKNIYFIIAFFLFLITIIPSVIAQPPFVQELDISEGFVIEPTLKNFIQKDNSHEFNIHVFNKSNGVSIIDNVCCYMHLYNKTGSHIYQGRNCVVDFNFDYTFFVDSGNFSDFGYYQAMFQCNSSVFGGFSEINFGVNGYGEELTVETTHMHNWSMLFLMILFILAIMGLFYFENPVGKWACYFIAHLFFIVGTFSVWQFNENYSIYFEATASIFKVLFYVSITALFPILILAIAWMVYYHTMNDTIKKMMNSGMEFDEAYGRAKSRRKF